MIFHHKSNNNDLMNDDDFSENKLKLKNLRPIKNIHLNNISFMYQNNFTII